MLAQETEHSPIQYLAQDLENLYWPIFLSGSTSNLTDVMIV